MTARIMLRTTLLKLILFVLKKFKLTPIKDTMEMLRRINFGIPPMLLTI